MQMYVRRPLGEGRWGKALCAGDYCGCQLFVILEVTEVPAGAYHSTGLCWSRLFPSEHSKQKLSCAVKIHAYLFLQVCCFPFHSPGRCRVLLKFPSVTEPKLSLLAQCVFCFLDHLKPVAKLTILFWLIVLIQETLTAPLGHYSNFFYAVKRFLP